jgi:phenylacetyl-CoA:acceptor oxidoreductase subunit 2
VTLSAVIAIIWAALRAWVWRTYQGALESEGAPTATLKVLHDFRLQFFVLGLALPSVLVVAGVAVTVVPAILFAIAGVCIASAGAFLKFILVTRAGFNQGFALVHTPVRGAGIAGPAVKPGWSRL